MNDEEDVFDGNLTDPEDDFDDEGDELTGTEDEEAY